MAKLTANELQKIRQLIKNFDFQALFNQLGWSNPLDHKINQQAELSYRHIAQLSGVVVLEVTSHRIPDTKTRLALHEQISKIHHEHLLIFIDNDKTQSCWSWLKRDGKKNLPRSHSYFKGQSGDLLLSKIININVDFQEFDNNGNIALVDITDKLKNALDIEPVTKKFFKDFQEKHAQFVEEIHGIPNEKQQHWYASVLLHRLMFIWFLQKKQFIDKGDINYLPNKLQTIKNQYGDNHYYDKFLKPLFFQGFAKPKNERSAEINQLLGDIHYLNGGLFLPHQIEEEYKEKIQVTDKAFTELFALFNQYSWNLNDSINGKDNEINPDVLGYIFEKYINQKAFGAYYTRPEITDYLCERTISKLILDKINQPEIKELNLPAIEFKDLPELLYKLDAPLCHKLLHDILPSLTLLDPACGSGAFLVAAMKTLIAIYSAIIGKIKFLNDAHLTQWLKTTETEHPNIDYFIKKQIIKHNLYGVDIMPEAMEIAKLRLFLALVSSAQKTEELEPLPNIDFNIMAGNSLIGLLTIESEKFNQLQTGKTGDLFRDIVEATTYQSVVNEKNRLIANYKDAQTYSENLTALRDTIDKIKKNAYKKLNQLLLAEFQRLQINYEQATWDDTKNKEGKAIKRPLTLNDINNLNPFHWGYEFDQVFNNGGFDAIITNPPWEVFKPQAKEFFNEHSELVTKNKMTIKDFEKAQADLLKNTEIKTAWLDYLSRFPFISLYFRNSKQFPHQTAVVNGKKTGSDINLYKLFTEQCFNLLKPNGECGIVIPSGIYTDLGATGLRQLLFNQTQITGLFCFENRKTIFEGVDSRFKFVVLTFKKYNRSPIASAIGENKDENKIAEAILQSFPAAFMRHEVSELTNFPNANSLYLNTDLIKKLSPDSQSIMEFKNELDITIAEKMLQFPLLGEQLENTWNLKLTREFDMTNDSHLFKTEYKAGYLPLYEGKMIHQFTHLWNDTKPKYWLDETEARKALLGKEKDSGQILDYQCYRLAFRDIARNTDSRTLISTIIPPAFHGNKLPTAKVINENGGVYLSNAEQLFICAVWNSFVIDWMIRQKVTTTLNFFYIYQLPIPRLTDLDEHYLGGRELIRAHTLFKPIIERAAALICTTPEFDDLKTEIFGVQASPAPSKQSLHSNREQTRAELDAMIAHLYGLTETEFKHILNTFPIVKEDIKQTTMAEFKKLAGETHANYHQYSQ